MHIIVYGAALTATVEGNALVEFLNTTNLEILNRGNEPTFHSGGRSEVIDITLGSLRLLGSIIGWEVSSEPYLSDHRHILFILRGSVPVHLIRNPWGTFREAFLSKDTQMTCLLAVGKFLNTVSGLMQWALSTIETWCNENRLSVNPDKTGLIAFTRKRKLQGFFEPQLFWG